MAEHIVEAVRLLEVVQLLGLAHPPAGREAPVGQVLEEHLVRHQARHGHHLPARGAHQRLVELVEFGHAVALHAQRGQPLQKLVADPALQHRGLAVVELAPDGVVGAGVAVHWLGDGEVGTQFVAGQQAGLELFPELGGHRAGKIGGGVRGGVHLCVSSDAEFMHSVGVWACIQAA
ncbi:hypothetical protein D3C85_1265430 [compost metagenome]